MDDDVVGGGDLGWVQGWGKVPGDGGDEVIGEGGTGAGWPPHEEEKT